MIINIKDNVNFSKLQLCMGVKWLSGRVLDSRPRGHGFEPHLCQYVVSLSKTH